MKKMIRYAAIIVVIIGTITVTINLLAWQELKNMIEPIENASEVQISVMNYRTGRSMELEDAAIIQKICEDISEIDYSGIFWGETLSTPDDQAYSLTIFSKDFHEIFILSASGRQSYAMGKNFLIFIKNYDALYKTVESAFQ